MTEQKTSFPRQFMNSIMLSMACVFIFIQVLLNHYEIKQQAQRLAAIEQRYQSDLSDLSEFADRLHSQIIDKPIEEMHEEVDGHHIMKADGPRSGKWPKVMHTHKDKHPLCQWARCETPDDRINVHHVIPVHWAKLIGHPWLELCHNNLITLCHTHHLQCGHGGNFKRLNLDIRADAKAGKFNSRGLSVWPGPDVMKKWLETIMGPPSETEPQELPKAMFDPSLIKIPEQAWHCNDCERMMVMLRTQPTRTMAP